MDSYEVLQVMEGSGCGVVAGNHVASPVYSCFRFFSRMNFCV